MDNKIALIGEGGVGKSAITLRYTVGEFRENIPPTIEELYKTKKMIDDTEVRLSVLDTAGQESYYILRDKYMRDFEALFVVYCIDDFMSWSAAKDTVEKIRFVKEIIDEQLMPVVLIGNKCDLEDKRRVKFEEVSEFAKSQSCLCIETSAKLNTNINEAFEMLIRRLWECEKQRRAKHGNIKQKGKKKSPNGRNNPRCSIL